MNEAHSLDEIVLNEWRVVARCGEHRTRHGHRERHWDWLLPEPEVMPFRENTERWWRLHCRDAAGAPVIAARARPALALLAPMVRR